jgi:lipid-binding SYLF domain-containing protein
MKIGKWSILLLALVLAVPPAFAGAPAAKGQEGVESADQVKKVEDCIRVLDEMMKEADKSIPLDLLRDCAGVAIIPDVIKAGFIVGGRYGRGVVLIRLPDGRWSDPAFISIKGGSVGWQAGVQSADVVLVFRTPRSVENITHGKFTLGADIGIAAGPLGRQAEASTDAQLKAEILSYSRSRGLYAGLSFQGSAIEEDPKADGRFYGGTTNGRDIFEGKVERLPEVARRLKADLDKYSR